MITHKHSGFLHITQRSDLPFNQLRSATNEDVFGFGKFAYQPRTLDHAFAGEPASKSQTNAMAFQGFGTHGGKRTVPPRSFLAINPLRTKN